MTGLLNSEGASITARSFISVPVHQHHLLKRDCDRNAVATGIANRFGITEDYQ
jgi:hypothetical protein